MSNSVETLLEKIPSENINYTRAKQKDRRAQLWIILSLRQDTSIRL